MNTPKVASVTRRSCLMLLLSASLAKYVKGNRVAFQRYYQATAVITFCGMTIFQKKDVGGGYAVAEEMPQGELNSVALQFAGGSWPEKAHGVNRLGYINEQIVERAAGEPVQAEYYGFMTSSGEKDFGQAKQALSDKSGKPVPYNATEGLAKPGVWNFSVSRLMMPARWTFTDCGQLNSHVRSAMAADQSPERTEKRFGAGPIPNTFLNSLRHALRNPAEVTDHELVYNGKAYRMHCTKQADGSLMRLSGLLEETATGQHTPFKLWYERDSANYLPVRIEYKAKSFLKLVFETEPHWQGPSPSLLLSKENA